MESGTIEQSLPGLEGTAGPAPMSIGRAIPLAPQKRLMLFAGRSNPELAQKIADNLGIELGAVTLKQFADGETYCRYLESIRGADVFIVQSPAMSPNDQLWELLIMIDAAKLASAQRITAVLPWYPYSRQDKIGRTDRTCSARSARSFSSCSSSYCNCGVCTRRTPFG